MLRIGLACGVLFAITTVPAFAQNSSGRPLHMGDTWIYHQVIDAKGRPEYSVFTQFSTPFTVNGGEFLFTLLAGATREELDKRIKAKGPAKFHGKSIKPDLCVIDVFEAVSLTNRPCTAPLAVGDSWSVDRETDNGHERSDYNVVGFEQITVQAGTFKAIKIKSDSKYEDHFDKLMQSMTGKKAESRTNNANNSNWHRATYWYVPDVKSDVKRYVEYLDDSGAPLFEETDELIEFKSRQ